MLHRIANTFNKYYSNITDDILSKRKYKGPKIFSDYLKTPTSNSFSLYKCDPMEIESLITTFNTQKKDRPT